MLMKVDLHIQEEDRLKSKTSKTLILNMQTKKISNLLLPL